MKFPIRWYSAQSAASPSTGPAVSPSLRLRRPRPQRPLFKKTAGKVHICLLLVSLILVGLWFTNTIVMCDDIDYSVLFALSSNFAGPANEATIIMCVLFCLNLIGSVIFFHQAYAKTRSKSQYSDPFMGLLDLVYRILYVCIIHRKMECKI